MVECSKGVELLQCQHQSLMRRWVHEVKVNEVIDACQEGVLGYFTVRATTQRNISFQLKTKIHPDSSAAGLHSPSWSFESPAQLFPPSHV